MLDGVLAWIAAVDGDLSRSWRSTLTAAARAPRRRPPSLSAGHLHGVPIAVKELFDVAHMPATYGSQALAGVGTTSTLALNAAPRGRTGRRCRPR